MIPVRPLYVWGGYVVLAIALAAVTGGANWVKFVMALYLIWAVVETVRFIRYRRGKGITREQAGEAFDEGAMGGQRYAGSLSDQGDIGDFIGDDDEDDFLADGKIVWKGSKTIRFAYGDFSGDKSDREVTVHQVVALGPTVAQTYFRGHCHLRDEPRTFRADRIKGRKVIDTETGEIATFLKTFGLRK